MKNKMGFTLIELLVVISIIGVLAMLIVPNLVGMRERARDAKKKSELVEMKKALRIYYNDNQSYPADIPDIGDTFTSADGSVVYMQNVPEYLVYGVDVEGENFTLAVSLENQADTDIANSWLRCDSSLVSSVEPETDYLVCQD